MNCINVRQLVDLAARRQVAVPAELGGCIVLAAADQLLSAPLELSASDLLLYEDGLLRLSGGLESEPVTAESRLRELLGTLLGSASSVTPALLRAARREPVGDIQLLVRELEIALVPTNRGASKRALARLCREARRAIAQSTEQSEPDSLLAVSPVAIPERRSPRPEGMPNIPDLDVRRPSVNQIASASLDAVSANSAVTFSWASDVLQLADVDVIDVIESVECPPALVDVIDVVESVECPPARFEAAPASRAVCPAAASASVLEPTAPFPLVHVIGPAEPSGISGEPCPRRPTPAASIRRCSRVKKPLFSAIRDQFAHTETQVDTATQSCDLPVSASEVINPVSNADGQSEPAMGEVSASLGQPVPELKGRQLVVGPHRFVARPCFAKKASKVTERVLKFGEADKGDPDQLVDSLQTLANGSNGG